MILGRRLRGARAAARTDVAPWPTDAAKRREPRHPVTAGVILDPFSELAFQFEWEQIPLRRSTWEEQLEANTLDLLFVESSWSGSDGSWRGQLTGTNGPSETFRQLLSHCREQGITTVFWNKEDPVHFDDFIDAARLFDFVYTTDANKVDEYVEVLGHDRVAVLPFAAQPSIHNPVRPRGWSQDDLRDVAFAGTYFKHKYPARRQQMDDLIGGAARAVAKIKGDLDIYSRFTGVNPNYKFPQKWQQYIRGELTYDQMLTAYRSYKAFLNVNSVVDSPSMCARRIFEITACGTPVLSAPSPAIEPFFPEGGVFVAGDEESAYNWVRAIAGSQELRDHEVKLGQREIWKHNTYALRVNGVLSDIGLDGRVWHAPAVSALVSTNRPSQLEHVARQMAQQQDVDLEVLLLTHGFEPTRAQREQIADLLPEVRWLTAGSDTSLGACYNRLSAAASGDVFAKIDDDDLYGPYYMFDQVAAIDYSGADIVGKGAHFMYLAAMKATVLRFPDAEHKYRDFVSGPTIMAKRDLVNEVRFPEVGRGEDTGFLRAARDAGAVTYSSDRFGFIQVRGAGADHTWHISQQGVLATSLVQSYGLNAETVLF